MNVWTSPAPFQNSRNFTFNPIFPVFNGSLLVNVKFPNFSGYEGGPLNGFYIVVEKSSNANRKRRSVCEFYFVCICSIFLVNVFHVMIISNQGRSFIHHIV